MLDTRASAAQLESVSKLSREASVFKENLKSVFVINRRIVNTAIGRDIGDALSEYLIPVLKTVISQRVSFAESAAAGGTVLDTDPNGAAAKEILALTEEILNLGV